MRSASFDSDRPRLPAAQFAQPFAVVECRPGGGHGPVDVLAATERRGRDHLAGGRIDDLERLAVGGVDGLAADRHPGRGRGFGRPGVGRPLVGGHG